MPLTQQQGEQLRDDGFVAFEGAIDPEFLACLRRRVNELFHEEGEQAGSEFKQEPGCRRLANLVNKGKVFQRVIAHPLVLECAALVLGKEFKLSSCNARSVNPRCALTQPLHCDMGAVPDERGFWVFNSVWMLDDFTPHNGAIRAIPGSHRWSKLPQDGLEYPVAPHPDEVLLTGPAGTLLVFNAHLWHGGLPNRTDRPRTAVHAFYARRDKPQQQYQKQMLSAEVQASLSSQLRKLLALDDPLNDQLSAAVAVRSGFLK
jgi:ectoine hydroxylase-related dioxygenase (phytanoyl-CoA dioxygenase family)